MATRMITAILFWIFRLIQNVEREGISIYGQFNKDLSKINLRAYK
ncbi:hypothetical protein SCACP_37010 [Sporomusa carbonis]